eukprot:1337703-Prymnesium_polylepis.1
MESLRPGSARPMGRRVSAIGLTAAASCRPLQAGRRPAGGAHATIEASYVLRGCACLLYPCSSSSPRSGSGLFVTLKARVTACLR